MMEDVNERHERVLLRPWLEIMLETSSIPGLEWFDKERMMFKVPWKHRSKKDWSIRHSSVFLEWARNTGRWNEGDATPYFAQLKTRLRCAFNKAPDIEEMKEYHSRNCEEPYKVYRFTTRKSDMKSCSRRATGSIGVSGSQPRTTVTMTAPRRVTNEMKAEMFADEDLHYTDVESVKTDFTYEYEKESVSVACRGNVDQGQQELYPNNLIPLMSSGTSSDHYFEAGAYNGQGTSQDQKPNSGVIPITVEELSSAESDDSEDHKGFVNFKADRQRAKCDTASQPVSTEQAPGGLLMLQVASLFVEAEASRQRSAENKDQDVTKGDGICLTEGSDGNTTTSDVKCSTASQAMDLTRRDQLDDGSTQLPVATSHSDVIDLTSRNSSPIEAVDLTHRSTPTDGRILPLARQRQNYNQPNISDSQAKTTQLVTPVRMIAPFNQMISDTGRGITSLTIRSRPLLVSQPLRTTPTVTMVAPRLSVTSTMQSGRLAMASGLSSCTTESSASNPVSFSTVPIVTVHRASSFGSPSVVSFSTNPKPVPILKQMMAGRMARPQLLQTVASEMNSSNVAHEQISMKTEPLTPTTAVMEHDIAEIETSPSPSHNATSEEIRRHYRAKEQLLIAKAQALLDKEKQLIMWEKQLLAKHESLYWKERCMQHERVQSSDGSKIMKSVELNSESNGDVILNDLSNQNAKTQFVCNVDDVPTANASPSIAALLKTKLPVLQARQHAPPNLSIISGNKVLTAPVVSMAVVSSIDRLARPPPPVRSSSPVRIVTSPISPADVSCSGPRLMTQTQENTPRFATRGFIAPRLPTPRIVLRTTPMTQPITQQKCLRILPAALNSRRLPLDVASQITSDMVIWTSSVSSSESRVLPPVYSLSSAFTGSELSTPARQLPLCVVETGDVSDEQESSDQERNGSTQDTNSEDVNRGEVCSKNNDVEGLNVSVTDVSSAGTSDTLTELSGQGVASLSSAGTNTETSGQGMVSLEQIRLSTERIVRQFQRQSSGTTTPSSVGSSVIESCLSTTGVQDNDTVNSCNKFSVDTDMLVPVTDSKEREEALAPRDGLAVELSDGSRSVDLIDKQDEMRCGDLPDGDEREVMGDKLVIADEAKMSKNMNLAYNHAEEKSCGELIESSDIVGKRKLDVDDVVVREIKLLRSA